MNNSDQSSSLEIIEPDNRINFSSGSSQNRNSIPQQDQLDYSKDEPSLSFIIEQQRRSLQKRKSEQINNQPPKRKRRQIFQKYKQVTQKPQNREFLSQISEDDDVLKTFDEVFKINTPRNIDKQDGRSELRNNNNRIDMKNKQTQQVTAFSKKNARIFDQNPSKFASENNLKTKQSFNNPTNPNKIIQNQNSHPIKNQPAQKEIFNGLAFFQTPFAQTPKKSEQEQYNLDDSINNFSFIDNKMSYIEGRSHYSMSKDAQQLASILNTEIFSQQPSKKYIEENIPSKLQIQSKDGQSSQNQLLSNRSSLIYQKIDLSSSLASSVMMKDSRFTMKQLSQASNNILGAEHYNMQKRTKTMQNIFYQQNKAENPINSKKIRQNIFHELRIPLFLKKVRELNQLYPNFNIVNLVYGNFFEEQNIFLQQLVSNVKIALNHLQNSMKTIEQYIITKNQLQKLLRRGISLKQFINFQWNRLIDMNDFLKDIRPRERYQSRKWDYKKACKALQNYQKIVDYYQGIKLNLKDERGKAKYSQIRQKFWDIERNIRMISEDLYTFALLSQIPQHYYEYYQLLKENRQNFSVFGFSESINKKTLLLQKALILKEKQENLSDSEVGNQVIYILKNMIKFSSIL